MVLSGHPVKHAWRINHGLGVQAHFLFHECEERMTSGSSRRSTTKTKSHTSQAHDPKPGAAVKGKQASDAKASAPSRSDRRQELMRQRREERLRYAEKHKKQQLLTRIALGVGALVLVAAIGYGIYDYIQDRPPSAPDGTISFENLSRDHDDAIPLQYDQHPPAGGLHNNTPQNCGYYSAPIHDEHAVHSLEHGAVWITYQPDLPQEQVDQLKELAESTSYILVSPYPDQDSPVIATAWEHQLKLDSVDDERLDQFIRVFRNSSKYTPEFGGACAGTTDTIES
jgi:hypothetical protein